MCAEMTTEMELEGARQMLGTLAGLRRRSLTIDELGVNERAPYDLLCLREALTWRTVEVGGAARGAIVAGDFAVAIILGRSLTESVALLWALRDLLANRDPIKGIDADKLMRMQFGMKATSFEDNKPTPINILTHLDRLDKEVPGIRRAYDNLSEVAHPNWMGVLNHFAKQDLPNSITRFGRGFESEVLAGLTADLLLASLKLFWVAHSAITREMPVYLNECSKS